MNQATVVGAVDPAKLHYGAVLPEEADRLCREGAGSTYAAVWDDLDLIHGFVNEITEIGDDGHPINKSYAIWHKHHQCWFNTYTRCIGN